MPELGSWRWDVDPSPYVSGIGHQVEIVNYSIDGLDGAFADPNIGGDGGAFVGGIVTACLLYLGYKFAKKKGYL